MSEISIVGVSKQFPNGSRALDDVNLGIEDGQFAVLVGPSGCGKTTLLRIIAGLEKATSGIVRIGNQDVTHLPPGDRDVAMVFQNYALYPHMTVAENLRFGLEVRKMPRKEIEQRTLEAAEMLGISEYLDRKPRQLSGGQRQRVAMGRAIVRRPLAFLMDEPLSNLDAQLRVSMRAELARVHTQMPTTTVYVTHDQVEAMTLGDQVTVLRDGVLQQSGSPEELFEHPVNVFVATFIGSPSMNIVQGSVAGDHVHAGELSIPLPRAIAAGMEGRDVIIGIRPSDLLDGRQADPALPRIEVTCDVVEYLGTEANLLFSVNARQIRGALADDDQEADPNASRARLTARVGRASGARPRDRVQLAVDVERLYFFDADTQLTIRAPGREAPVLAPT
jgi:multiple sugar transport system ATP-binding protein